MTWWGPGSPYRPLSSHPYPPPLLLSLLLPQKQSFSCMSGRTEAFNAQTRMPLKHKEMVDPLYLLVVTQNGK